MELRGRLIRSHVYDRNHPADPEISHNRVKSLVEHVPCRLAVRQPVVPQVWNDQAATIRESQMGG